MSLATELPPAVPAELLAFPDTPERRLRRALRQLDQALAEQRAAVGALRTQLGHLGGAVASLGDTAQGLRGALEGAAAEARRAQLASRELLATAEMMESVARR